MKIRAMHTGINLREAVKLAVALGCRVEQCRGSGDYALFHESLPGPNHVLIFAGHHKSAPLRLTVFLKRLKRTVEPA